MLTSFYQLATHEAHGRLVLRLLCVFCMCLFVSIYNYTCASPLTSRTLLPCDLTLVDFGILVNSYPQSTYHGSAASCSVHYTHSEPIFP